MNLTTPKTRRIRGDLIVVFKIIRGIDDLPSDYLFQERNEDENRLREHQHVLTNPRARLDVKRYSLSHRTVTELDRLLSAFIEADRVNAL